MSKQEVLNAISALPDDVSFDDVIYHQYVLKNVSEGKKDIENGHTFTQSQVKAMFSN